MLKRGLRLVFPESLVQPFPPGVQVMFLAGLAVLGRATAVIGELMQVSGPLAQTLSCKSHLDTANRWMGEVLCAGA